MKKCDVIIIGKTVAGLTLAADLIEKKKSVVLVQVSDKFPLKLRALTPYFQTGTLSNTLPPIPEGLNIIDAPCSFKSNKMMLIGNDEYEYKRVILAQDPVLTIPSIKEIDNTPFDDVLTFIERGQTPESLMILGAGPLGCLLADHVAPQINQVTLFSKSDRILPHEEPEISAIVHQNLEKRGVKIVLGGIITEIIEKTPVTLRVQSGDGFSSYSAEQLVLATGYKPALEQLKPKNAYVYVNPNGKIVINDDSRTSEPPVWALGAITDHPVTLANEELHIRCIKQNIYSPFFNRLKMYPDPFPRHIPLKVPVATIGKSEIDAKREHEDIITANFPLQDYGHIKLLARKRNGKLMGAHVVSKHAEELIHLLDLVMRAEIPVSDIAEDEHFIPLTEGASLLQAIQKWGELAGK